VFLLTTKVPWLSRSMLNIATRASSGATLPGCIMVDRSVISTMTEKLWIRSAMLCRVVSQMST
jgi:hypothetical protein